MKVTYNSRKGETIRINKKAEEWNKSNRRSRAMVEKKKNRKLYRKKERNREKKQKKESREKIESNIYFFCFF